MSTSGIRVAVRVAGFTVGILIGVLFGAVIHLGSPSSNAGFAFAIVALAIGGIGYILGPHVLRSIFHRVRDTIAEASIEDIVATAIGFAFGALVAAPIAFIVSLAPGRLGDVVALMLASVIISIAVGVAHLRKEDLINPWFLDRRQPATDLSEEPITATTGDRPILVDTNIAIDGRIGDVLRTGFLSGQIILPRFVLDELQRIADSDDPQRRVRGRRGLEALNAIRASLPDDRVQVVDDPVPSERQVDAKLVRLALDRGARILTNDYNLEKVAQVQGIEVLNFNELTSALRPIVRPGEELTLNLVQEGREAGQGVGFLDDGTMVVVDGGRRLVGSETAVTVTRLLQTGAGKMVFATPKQASA